MGLTFESTGSGAIDGKMKIKRGDGKVIALAGNPNVGKSSVFNRLTGLRQHTGNWPGKTVSSAQGRYRFNNKDYILVDIPGTYSLAADSKEEEVARDFICFGDYDAIVVVCDATCLERNLNLVLQCLEITDNVIVCLNLMDEAKKKNIHIDSGKLSELLEAKVVETSARDGSGLKKLMGEIEAFSKVKKREKTVEYLEYIKTGVKKISPFIKNNTKLKTEWIALKLLEGDNDFINKICKYIGYDLKADKRIAEIIKQLDFDTEKLKEDVAKSVVLNAEYIFSESVSSFEETGAKVDKILTGRVSGSLVMLALLGFVFWLTISGANALSEVLSRLMFFAEDKLLCFLIWLRVPKAICEILTFGVFRVTGWVVSVMLPPMAIFFPLFTLLEDLGYLPRVAFNLDKTFKKCNACGKQALTMCMGFGCNAAGVVGTRIISSPRERLIAAITNSFVPCNGKFPTIIAIITMFFTFSFAEPFKSVLGAVALTAVVLLGILATFFVSKLLSVTVLKGEAFSFVLELPPYRRPKIGSVIVRSVFDRSLFVLGRAIAVAAPAGAVIWILSNVTVSGVTLLSHAAHFLDPVACFMGMDGVILLAFILGLPANELVVPLIIMAYTSSASMGDAMGYEAMKALFVSKGWSVVTAVNVIVFSLMHWPCSTTLLTVKKETGSLKWTFASFILPTVLGITVCIVFTFIARVFM